MSRPVLVPAGAPVLRSPGTHVLHRYPGGAALVEVDDGGEPIADLLDPGAPEAAPTGDADELRPPAGPGAEADPAVTAYVEFVARPDARWLSGLQALGITVLAYQPVDSYLCFGPLSAFEAARTQITTSEGSPAVRSVRAVTAEQKPTLAVVGEAGNTVVIVVAAAPGERADVLRRLGAVPGVQLLDGAGNDALDGNRFRIRARVQSDGLAALLALPRVLSVEEFVAPVPEDEMAGLVVAGLYDTAGHPAGSYLDWLRDNDVDGRGTTIGIVDGGVDVSHPAFTGRIRDLDAGRRDWHATMVAGHAAGNYLDEKDAAGLAYGLGTAPGANLLSQDRSAAAGDLCRQTVREAGRDAAVQNNSWGKETRDPMDYGSDEALYDALVRNADPASGTALTSTAKPLTICFSSGNSGPRGLTRPKAAKNVIVTGNSESFRPDVGGVDSDDIREVCSNAHGSSYGNCGDGRIRPHLVAPGEWTASANCDSHPGEDEYLSPMLTWGGGSSGASPKTAGACALLVQWWRAAHAGADPSPALLRALLVNGAEPISTGGPVPNVRQGWGRLNVRNVVDPAASLVCVDQTVLLSQPGEVRGYSVRVVDPARPLKVTLAWTDPPGPVGSGGSPDASCVVNRLALRVETGGDTFRGTHDRFRGGWSASDADLATPGPGSAPATLRPEGCDNLQNVFLPARPAPGIVRISVTALDVTTDCLTGGFGTPRQDYALVVSNGEFDPAAAPGDVVVVVDAGAGGPAPADHDDAHAADDDAAGTEPPASSPDEAAWWAAPETAAEAVRDPVDLASKVDLAATVREGVELLTTVGHRGRSADVGPSTPGTAITGITGIAAADRPAATVLVLSAGTRVSAADVRTLRALAATGGLLLVADSADLLAVLAERIGPRPGVRYRWADSAAELPALLTEVIAEAGGLQPVVLPPPATVAVATGTALTHRFGVVAADRAIVVRLAHTPGATPTEVRLVRPGAADVVWPGSAATQAPGAGADGTWATGTASVRTRDGLVEVLVPQAGRAPGAWSLRTTTGHGVDSVAVHVWALGGPAIRTEVRPMPAMTPSPGATAGTTAVRRLVRVEAEAGATLRQLTLPGARTRAGARGPGAAQAEDQREVVVVRARRSRLDGGGPAAEDDRAAVPVPALGHVVEVAEGTALDLPLDVVGNDADGVDYARRVRVDLVRTPDPTRGGAARPVARAQHVSGRVTRLERRDGAAVAVHVAKDGRTRRLDVAAPLLAAALGAPPAAALIGQTVVLRVRGTRLLALYHPLLDVDPLRTAPDRTRAEENAHVRHHEHV